MDLAEVHHKGPQGLREDEDVLTSHVFGLLEFVHHDLCLIPWLNTATRQDGIKLSLGGPYESVETRYWPRYPDLGDRTEPDVVMAFMRPDRTVDLLVIEVKYLSGPSELPVRPAVSSKICGQLGREWRIAAGLKQWQAPDTAAPPACISTRRLVYLTQDTEMPRSIMNDMTRENEDKAGAPGMREGLYWLYWRDLMPLVRQARSVRQTRVEARALDRLERLLAERHLDALQRIEPLGSIAPVGWSYASRYQWTSPRVSALPLTYRGTP